MKKILIAALILLTLAVDISAAKRESPKEVSLSNQSDSVNYAIGVMVGYDLRRQLDETLGQQQNADLISQGLSTTLKRETQHMSKEMADSIVNAFMTMQIQKKTGICLLLS